MTEMRTWRAGGCHCGAVRFEVNVPDSVEVESCNCSMCTLTGYLHMIVPANRFRITSGTDQLASYSFGTHTADHKFCSVCGIKSFYIPRSNPDGFSVNVRCMDAPDTFADIRVVKIDGRGNWEQATLGLARKSKD